METKRHILVLDDDIYLSEMISEVLTSEGFTVTTLQDGTSLLEKLDEYNPDLVLLDIRMPGLNGYDVLKGIRLRSTVPVIMLTGVTETESIADCIEMGADDYIKKPFYPHELIARIKAKLRRRPVIEKVPT